MDAIPATRRLYLESADELETSARVLAVADDAIAFDRSPFYPGGGGQPCDLGSVRFSGGPEYRVEGIRTSPNDVLWHQVDGPIPAGIVDQTAILVVNAARRLALTRYHTVLHVLNTITLRDFDGWITGVQISEEYARIDFRLEALTPALCAELERKVNAVLAVGHPIHALYVTEGEFRERPELLRSLEAKPPIKNGMVRIVEIEGFDAQACGGTHVHALDQLGRFSIFRTENKGKINKRLYVKLN